MFQWRKRQVSVCKFLDVQNHIIFNCKRRFYEEVPLRALKGIFFINQSMIFFVVRHAAEEKKTVGVPVHI